jgi:hypothetical protein
MAKRQMSSLARWASEEAQTLIPDWVGALFLGARRATRLEFSAGVTGIDRQDRRLTAPIALLSGPMPALKGKPAKPVEVDAALPATAFLARQIEAPAKAAAQMQAIAGLDLARRTPFKPGAVFWALSPARVVDGKALATQWVLHRADVKQLEERLAAQGLILRKIRVEGQAQMAPLYDPAREGAPRRNAWAMLNGVLAVGTLAAGLFAWGWPAWQDANALPPELAALEQTRTEALTLRQEIDA